MTTTTRQETTMNTTDAAYTALSDAHRELVRYQARTGGDWTRDGFSIQAAQATVDAAKARYDAAFTAYVAEVA